MLIRRDTSVIFNEEFDNDSYYAFKLYELLLTESNLNSWIKNYPIFSTYNFLDGFLDFINMMIDNNFLSYSIKDNILKYLVLVRFNDDKRVETIDEHSFEERVNLINKIIRLVNSGKDNNYITFYRNELIKRTGNLDYLHGRIADKEAVLFESMKFDQQVIYSHSNAVSDSKFTSDYIPIFVSDYKYFQTINCILAEYPKQFRNSLFKQRYDKTISNYLKYNLSNSKKCVSVLYFDQKVRQKIKQLDTMHLPKNMNY